jgi:hypothetical protein
MSPLSASWSSVPFEAEAATAVPPRTPSPQPCIICWGVFYSPIYPTPPHNMPIHGNTICPLVPGFKASTANGGIVLGTTGRQAKIQPPGAGAGDVLRGRDMGSVAPESQTSSSSIPPLIIPSQPPPQIVPAPVHLTLAPEYVRPTAASIRAAGMRMETMHNFRQWHDDIADPLSPSQKRARTVPAPLPAEPAEPTRCTKSFTASRKRARKELPEEDPSILSPPPSKKHRGEASASAVTQTKVVLKTEKTPTAASAASNLRRSKRLLKARASVPNSTATTSKDLKPTHTTLPSRRRKRLPPANEDEVRASSYKRRRLVAPEACGTPNN